MIGVKIKIPNSWQKATLEELLIYVIGGDWGKDPMLSDPEFTLALCIRGSEFRDWYLNKGNTASERKIKLTSLENRKLQLGDILLEISGGGPDQPVGRTVLIDKQVLSFRPTVPKVCTNFLRLLRFPQELNKKFLNHYFHFFYHSGEVVKYQGGSNNLRNLKFKEFVKIFFPLPPLAEQHRIVAKIEELFSELDQGVAQLQLAQQQLKVYRQALLKHAFEGKLTEEWRKQQEDLPDAKDLLAEIKEARAEYQAQQLADWKQAVKEWENSGKEGRKPTKPRKPKEVRPIGEDDLEKLGEMPEGWQWVKLAKLAESVGGVTKGRKLEGLELITLPYLRVANVQDGYLDLDEVKTIDVLPSDFDKYKLLKGDILHTEGGDKDKLGRGTIWNDEIKNCIHQNHIFRSRLYHKEISPKYVAYFSQSKGAKDYFFQHAKQTTNLASINLTVLSNLPLPLPSIAEQRILVEELESNLSVCENLEDGLEYGLQQAQALRQSILKKAFEGRLVPQNPNDEPAKELLMKIQIEKEAYLKEQKARKKAQSKRKKNMAKKNLSIIEVLERADRPLGAKEVWEKSKHKEDIEEFYAELKRLGSFIEEIREGVESKLILKS